MTSLNLSEIDQHHREWAAGAGCALPFGTERLPEETPGLDAGEAIGDRLLLQFLEHERVVQRGREKIGKRIQDQNILWSERILVAAFDVEHAEQRFAVADRQAEDGSRFRKHSGKLSGTGVLHQSTDAAAGDLAEDATAHGDPAAKGLRTAASLGFDLDVLGGVVHDADADVIVVEVFLDLAHDVGHHLLGIFAGDGHFRNAVQEGEMAGAALLFSEQAGVFDGYAKLAGGGLHDLEIPGLKLRFALCAQCGHDSRRPAAEKNGNGAERARGAGRDEVDSKFCAYLFQIGFDQQRRSGAEDVLRQSVPDLARTFGKGDAAFDLQLKADFIFFLKGDVEGAGIENLAELDLHRAQHLFLVEVRADGLADFGQQFVFLGAALRFVHDNVVFERQRDLQREADEQPQVRIPEHAAFGVRKQEDAEVVLARLEAHRHHVGDAFREQSALCSFETSAGKRRQRFFQFGDISESDDSTAPVCEFGNVIPGLGLLQPVEEVGGKALLYRRESSAELLGNKKDGAMRRQRGDEPVDKSLQARLKLRCREQTAWVDSQTGERQCVFLYGIALVFEQHHHHGDGEQHLRNGAEEASQLADDVEEGLVDLPGIHQCCP